MIVLEFRQADVTRLDLNAITNAANTQLKHGSCEARIVALTATPTRAPFHRRCAYCEEIAEQISR